MINKSHTNYQFKIDRLTGWAMCSYFSVKYHDLSFSLAIFFSVHHWGWRNEADFLFLFKIKHWTLATLVSYTITGDHKQKKEKKKNSKSQGKKLASSLRAASSSLISLTHLRKSLWLAEGDDVFARRDLEIYTRTRPQVYFRSALELFAAI